MTLFGNPNGEISYLCFCSFIYLSVFGIQQYSYEDVICFSNFGFLSLINSDIYRSCAEKTIKKNVSTRGWNFLLFLCKCCT
jgi:hypothetical protein